MTSPTRQEIIRAHEVLDTVCDLVTELRGFSANEYRNLILRALPPIPHSTMADVNWEHSKHYLTVAESTKNEERYIMLCPEMSEHIRCISEDPHRSTEVILREYLIPTDDKYRLNREVL